MAPNRLHKRQREGAHACMCVLHGHLLSKFTARHPERVLPGWAPGQLGTSQTSRCRCGPWLRGFAEGPSCVRSGPSALSCLGFPMGPPGPHTHLILSLLPQMFPLPVANGKGRPTPLAGAQFGGSGRTLLPRGRSQTWHRRRGRWGGGPVLQRSTREVRT